MSGVWEPRRELAEFPRANSPGHLERKESAIALGRRIECGMEDTDSGHGLVFAHFVGRSSVRDQRNGKWNLLPPDFVRGKIGKDSVGHGSLQAGTAAEGRKELVRDTNGG